MTSNRTDSFSLCFVFDNLISNRTVENSQREGEWGGRCNSLNKMN